MSIQPPAPPTSNTEAIPDGPGSPALPLTLASSTLVNQLPHDATSALSVAVNPLKPKVTVHFTAIGSAPSLRQTVSFIFR